MNARHPMGVLHSFSIKNSFYDKMDLRLFCFNVTIYPQFNSQRRMLKKCQNVEAKPTL